jgi:hypothetical protein
MHAGEEHTGYTFKYSLASGWNSDSYALCAAAIATLNGIGVYATGATWNEHDIGKVYAGGLKWLRFKFDDFIGRRKAGQGSLDVSHFYYAHFYAAQAMWNAPEEVYFDEYFPKLRDLLVDEQKRNPANNGGWPSQSYGEAYTTAYAPLTDRTSTRPTVIAVTSVEFTSAVPSSPRLQASPMLPKAGGHVTSHGAR